MLGLLGLLGLQPSRDPAAHCAALVAAERLEEAAVRCAETFDRTRDPRAGLAAGNALLALGDTESALAWSERLVHGAEAAEAWRLAARVHEKREDAAREKEANLRELALRRAGGEHARAAEVAYRRFYFANEAANYREALDFARQSLEESMSAADRGLEAQALQAVSAVLYEVGDSPRAQRLLPRWADLLAPEQSVERARLLNLEGLIRLDTGRPELARDAFERAIELAGPSEDRQVLFSAHVNLTKTRLELGDTTTAERSWELARRYVDSAVSSRILLQFYQARLLQARGQLTEAAQVLKSALAADPGSSLARDLEVRLGRVEEARGDLPAAAAAYRRAADGIEAMRASAGSDEIRSLFADDNRRPFEALFRLFARSGREAEALEIVEHTKARTFLEAVLHSGSEAKADEADGPAIAFAAGQRLAALEALLPSASESPLVASRPLDESLAHLGDRPLLAYFEAGDELWLIVVSAGRVEIQLLPASPARVRELVQRFLELPDDLATADELRATLLPAGALPEPGPKPGPLLIATDGVLGDLPFAALRRQGRFFVEDFAIAYVPSASALAAIETRPTGPVGPAVVLADPRGDLAEAALEARLVAARLAVPPQLGGAATRARLREAARADILHLATHTGLGARGAWLALHDGEVAAERIITERIGPRLVVLAGCASAARPGRGMWGSLGSAFLVAGSRTVVASLWSVEDSLARELVQRFYDQGGAADPAGALAAAQRDLIAAGRPVSAWAPFVVLGSDRSQTLLH